MRAAVGKLCVLENVSTVGGVSDIHPGALPLIGQGGVGGGNHRERSRAASPNRDVLRILYDGRPVPDRGTPSTHAAREQVGEGKLARSKVRPAQLGDITFKGSRTAIKRDATGNSLKDAGILCAREAGGTEMIGLHHSPRIGGSNHDSVGVPGDGARNFIPNHGDVHPLRVGRRLEQNWRTDVERLGQAIRVQFI